MGSKLEKVVPYFLHFFLQSSIPVLLFRPINKRFVFKISDETSVWFPGDETMDTMAEPESEAAVEPSVDVKAPPAGRAEKIHKHVFVSKTVNKPKQQTYLQTITKEDAEKEVRKKEDNVTGKDGEVGIKTTVERRNGVKTLKKGGSKETRKEEKIGKIKYSKK